MNRQFIQKKYMNRMVMLVYALLAAVALCLTLACSLASAEETSAWAINFSQLFGEDADRVPKALQSSAGKADVVAMQTFRLPASLKSIEDEAFEGTAIVSVDLPETVESIGENAFARIPSLRVVRIPEKTKQIAKTAFAGSNNVTIIGSPGSYARTWAHENGIPFVPIVVMFVGADNNPVSSASGDRQTQVDTDCIDLAEGTRRGIQWRFIGEIKAEQCEQFIANHILGRAPPVIA